MSVYLLFCPLTTPWATSLGLPAQRRASERNLLRGGEGGDRLSLGGCWTTELSIRLLVVPVVRIPWQEHVIRRLVGDHPVERDLPFFPVLSYGLEDEGDDAFHGIREARVLSEIRSPVGFDSGL
jgi:hypothetical protein